MKLRKSVPLKPCIPQRVLLLSRIGKKVFLMTEDDNVAKVRSRVHAGLSSFLSSLAGGFDLVVGGEFAAEGGASLSSVPSP